MTRRMRRLLFGAFIWGLLAIGAAFVLPVYDGEALPSTSTHPGVIRHITLTQTLVGVNGLGVVELLAVPLLVVLLVAVALDIRERRRSDVAHCVAVVLATLLAFGNVLALFTIGIFVLPITAMLIMAVLRPSARLAPARR